jgi:hypothetical protein
MKLFSLKILLSKEFLVEKTTALPGIWMASYFLGDLEKMVNWDSHK